MSDYVSSLENLRRKGTEVACQQLECDLEQLMDGEIVEGELLEAPSVSGGKLYYVLGFATGENGVVIALYGSTAKVEKNSGILSTPKKCRVADVYGHVTALLRKKRGQNKGYETVRIPPAIPATNEMHAFLQCKLCLEELPAGQSPREYARFSVGWTSLGLQVWCVRHEVNVLHVNFEGRKHPANTNRVRTNATREEFEALFSGGQVKVW